MSPTRRVELVIKGGAPRGIASGIASSSSVRDDAAEESLKGLFRKCVVNVCLRPRFALSVALGASFPKLMWLSYARPFISSHDCLFSLHMKW